LGGRGFVGGIKTGFHFFNIGGGGGGGKKLVLEKVLCLIKK